MDILRRLPVDYNLGKGVFGSFLSADWKAIEHDCFVFGCTCISSILPVNHSLDFLLLAENSYFISLDFFNQILIIMNNSTFPWTEQRFCAFLQMYS